MKACALVLKGGKSDQDAQNKRAYDVLKKPSRTKNAKYSGCGEYEADTVSQGNATTCPQTNLAVLYSIFPGLHHGDNPDVDLT